MYELKYSLGYFVLHTSECAIFLQVLPTFDNEKHKIDVILHVDVNDKEYKQVKVRQSTEFARIWQVEHSNSKVSICTHQSAHKLI